MGDIMVFNKNMLFILAATVTFSSVGPLIAQKQTEPREEYAAVTVLDKLVDEGQKQLKKIRVCLASISSIVKKNKNRPEETQKKIVKHFRELDQVIIESLTNEKFLEVDLITAYSLLQLNNIIINHINELIKSDFKDIDACNIKTLLEKATITKTGGLKPQQIYARLQSNNKKLDELVKKAQGLRWYNHISRGLDEWVVTPCQRYSIPRRVGIALGVTALAGLFFWQLYPKQCKELCDALSPKNEGGKTLFDKGIGQPYRREQAHDLNKILILLNQEETNLFKTEGIEQGHTDQFNPAAKQNFDSIEARRKNATDELDDGYLRKGDQFLSEWKTDFSDIAKLMATLVAGGLLLEVRHFYPEIKKKLDIWKNKFKGGVYMKEAERAAEKVETVRFDDIFGQNEIKRYLQLLVDYLEDPETFDRLGLTPPKGILCIGDTRTGKTFCVNALFGEINDMLERTGQAGKYKLFKLDVLRIKIDGMESILRKVKYSAPCIVFIDEIDLLDLQRTGENRTLSEFLTAMGDAVNSKDSKKQVILIAATNRPETLDIALRQPGRFGKEVRFEYPNYQDRFGFIKARLEELSLSSDAINIEKMTRYTENKSYEALNMLIKDAIIKARLRGEVLTQSILDEALDEDIYHIIPNYTKQVPLAEQNILAAHFAGQALVLTMLNNDVHLAKVTIKQVMTELKEEVMGMHLWTDEKTKQEQQRFEYGKIFTCHEKDSININTCDAKLKLCKMYLAGFIAEELLLGSCAYSCHAESDKLNALSLAQSIAFEGYDMKTMPKHIQNKKYDAVFAIIEQCKNEVRELLTQNKDTLNKLSEELLKHQTLDHLQVNEIVQPTPQVAPAA